MSEKIQPKVRFSGFTDAWEQRKLGDIVVFLNGRAYKQAELLDSGKYPVLRVGNFNTNDKWYYSDLELPAKNYADKGDLLYTWATAFGPHIWKGPKVIYHYHIWKVETTSDISKNFAVHLLDADQAQMTNSLNGSTMVHITKGTMENKIVTIPGISEQRNMARLLDQLDCTIALHQSKLEELKTVKKLAMQKIFDQEWRFKGFTDPWEQRKFKNYILKSGKNPKNPKEYIAYSVSNKSGLIKQSDQFEDSRLDSLNKISYKLVKPLEFAYNPARINVGSIAFNNTKKPVIVSSLYVVLKLNSSLNNEYILQFIRSADFINEVKRNTEGSVREYLFINNFKNIKFPYSPNKDEQIKIGELLSTLDSLIAANQQKCDQLKKVKKWCMQNLFV